MRAVPSAANFVMVPMESKEQAQVMTASLLRMGVVIRPLKAFGLAACVRISTGTDEENQILLDAVKTVCVNEAICKN